MFGFGQLIDILKKDPKKIVFTEGNDPRILEAASRLLAGTFLHPILVGNPDEILRLLRRADSIFVALRSLIRQTMTDLTRW